METQPRLNPWWLKYFAMLDLIDRNKVTEQRKIFKKIDRKNFKPKLKKEKFTN